MIKSLYNLTKQINNHINKLSSKKEFQIDEIKPIFEKYNANDWTNYKHQIPIKVLASPQNFKRIPVIFPDLECSHNNIYDMYLVSWEPFSNTGLQNHPDSSCLIKVLDGEINKQLFHSNGTFISTKSLIKDDIESINSEKDLYRITNDTKYMSYSLHLYSPPILDLEMEFQDELINRNNAFFKKTPHIAKEYIHALYNKKN
jgi:hypothetical protein